MIIETRKIDELLPADYNPRKDLKPTDVEYKKIKRSILEFGYVDPIIWNRKTNTVVGGHQRLKVLKDMGHKEVVVSVVELSTSMEKALNVALNKISGEWDSLKLEDALSDLASIDDFDIGLTGFDMDEINDILADSDPIDPEDEGYTKKIEAPVYEPTGNKPQLSELLDDKKAYDFVDKVKKSTVDEDIKNFLIKAAERHIVFNYDKIANYYAHSDPNVQELMEDLALVIIDFDKAIENGYLQLSEDIQKQYVEEKR